MERRNQTIIKLSQTALMAALCFVSFTFLQIKIPMPQNFLKEVMADGKDHERQCKTELYVCDYLINDLVIYSPELHTGHIREIKRDPAHDRMLLSKMRVAVRHREHATDVIKKLLTV